MTRLIIISPKSGDSTQTLFLFTPEHGPAKAKLIHDVKLVDAEFSSALSLCLTESSKLTWFGAPCADHLIYSSISGSADTNLLVECQSAEDLLRKLVNVHDLFVTDVYELDLANFDAICISCPRL